MKRVLKWFGLLLFVALIGLGALRLFVFDLATVVGEDMLPTLGKESYMIVNRRTVPKRGDLIMFRVKGSDAYLVRRVVALPGESVAIVDSHPVVPGHEAKHLVVRKIKIAGREYDVQRETIDGRSWEVLDDTMRTISDKPAAPVEEGYFVMSDNREHGKDSRELGAIPKGDVRGVVWNVLDRGALP